MHRILAFSTIFILFYVFKDWQMPVLTGGTKNFAGWH